MKWEVRQQGRDLMVQRVQDHHLPPPLTSIVIAPDLRTLLIVTIYFVIC